MFLSQYIKIRDLHLSAHEEYLPISHPYVMNLIEKYVAMARRLKRLTYIYQGYIYIYIKTIYLYIN